MNLTITGDAYEIAALVDAIQERRKINYSDKKYTINHNIKDFIDNRPSCCRRRYEACLSAGGSGGDKGFSESF